MKPFGLLNSLLAFFGGAAVAIAMHLYRAPREYILMAYAVEYAVTYISVWVGGILMLLLAGLGSYAALEPNLKTRRVMLILYVAVLSVLLIGEEILGVWLVVRANWALRHLPPEPIDSDLKEFLQEVSLSARVDGVVAAWLSSLFLLQIVASVMAGVEMRRASYELRLRRKLNVERELTFM